MKKIVVLLILSLMLFGCAKKENDSKKEITVQEKNTEYIIVDVRTKEEYDEGHVEGAINIPYDEIDESVNLDKNKIIMIYCKSGARSKIAYNTLKELGYDVQDLGAYSSVNLPKVTNEND